MTTHPDRDTAATTERCYGGHASGRPARPTVAHPWCTMPGLPHEEHDVTPPPDRYTAATLTETERSLGVVGGYRLPDDTLVFDEAAVRRIVEQRAAPHERGCSMGGFDPSSGRYCCDKYAAHHIWAAQPPQDDQARGFDGRCPTCAQYVHSPYADCKRPVCACRLAEPTPGAES